MQNTRKRYFSIKLVTQKVLIHTKLNTRKVLVISAETGHPIGKNSVELAPGSKFLQKGGFRFIGVWNTIR